MRLADFASVSRHSKRTTYSCGSHAGYKYQTSEIGTTNFSQLKARQLFQPQWELKGKKETVEQALQRQATQARKVKLLTEIKATCTAGYRKFSIRTMAKLS